MAVWYIDDFGRKHYTVINEVWEYKFLQDRFSYVSLIKEEIEEDESPDQA